MRWLHLYVSLIGFATIFFFAVTGITLNHAEFFESAPPKEREIEEDLPRTLIPETGTPDRKALADHFREKHRLSGEVDDFSVDPEYCSLIFKGPAYTADISIDRATAHATVRETRLGLAAHLDDLHKGRDTGRIWSIVIDVSAALMAVSSLTGLWLLFYVRRRRVAGLLTTMVGTVVLLVLAVYFV